MGCGVKSSEVQTVTTREVNTYTNQDQVIYIDIGQEFIISLVVESEPAAQGAKWFAKYDADMLKLTNSEFELIDKDKQEVGSIFRYQFAGLKPGETQITMQCLTELYIDSPEVEWDKKVFSVNIE